MKAMLLFLALLAPAVLQAQSKADTVEVKNAHRVVVVNGDSLLRVRIDGRQGDSLYHYEAMLQAVDSNYVSRESLGKDFTFDIMGIKKRSDYKEAYETFNLHWAIGFNSTPDAPAGIDVSTFSSSDWGFWFDWERALRHGSRHRFSIGIGFNWRCFRMTGRNQFVKADNGTVSVEPLPEGSDPNFSRIKVFSFIVPIQYHYRISRKWGVTLGPTIHSQGKNNATILTRYTDAEGKHKVKYKHIHPSPITVDLMGAIDTPVGSFYVRYNPCNVLDSEYAPKFHSLSFGVMF